MSLKRGFALIFVLGFAACIIAFAAVIGARATQNLRFASTKGQAGRALDVAQTGTQLVFSCLREPPVMRDATGAVDPTVTWLGDDCSVVVPVPSVNGVAYAHLYHNIASLGSQAQAVAPDLTPIGVDNFYIVSVGAVNSVVESGSFVGGVRYEQVTMGTTLQPSFPMLPQAAFASDSLTIDGRVDYFDSTQLASTWASFASGADGTNPEASVALDQKTVPSSAVNGTGGAKVLGNFLMSAHASASDITAAASNIAAGGTMTALGAGTLPEAPNQYALPGAVAGGDKTQPVTGQIARLSVDRLPFVMANDETRIVQPHFPVSHPYVNQVLEEGKIYKQDGDLKLDGTSTITVNDTNHDSKIEDVILLVEGNITFESGAKINELKPPRQLKIYSLKPAGGVFTLTGGHAYCLVSGADLTVNIAGASELWGAVLGKSVTLAHDAKLHYDVQLRNPTSMADVYDFRIIASVSSQGAKATPGQLSQPGGAYGGTGTSGVTSGAGTSGTGTSGTGGCGGCGCGGGSMLLAAKEMALE